MMAPRVPAGQRFVLLLSALFVTATVILAIVGVHVSPGTAHADPSASKGRPVTALDSGTAASTAAELASRALVTVSARPAARALQEPISVGSGVLVEKNVVVMSAQLAAGMTDFAVSTPGQARIPASLVGTDSATNLAVLTLADATSGLAPLTFADSSMVKVGQPVLVAANRRGVGPSVTLGLIAARPERASEAYEPFLRTDALRSGDVNGVLVDWSGELVGIPAPARSSGDAERPELGFVLPSNTVRTIVTSLLKHDPVEHGFIGVRVQDLDAALASALEVPVPNGVLIAEVGPASPGERGGLERADVVLAIDGHPVSSAFEFRSRIAATKPGSKLDLELFRQGLHRSVEVTLGAAREQSVTTAPAAQRRSSSSGLGLVLSGLDRTERRRWTIPDSLRSGLVVDEVTAGTPGASSGLLPGDVLLELNREAVTTPTEVARRWKEASGAALVLAWRAGRTAYVALQPFSG